MPIAIVNLGECRAGPLATLRLDADCTDALPALRALLRPAKLPVRRWVQACMTYRDDDQAGEARRNALANELRAVDRSLAEKPALQAKRRALADALRHAEDAAGKRRAKLPLPLLQRVQIASPCDARWDEMPGDARVRHCASCDKDVYDLSEMTTSDAETLLSREGPTACVRLHRRADGTVITTDCPVGAKKKRRRRWLAAGAAVAGSVVAAAAAARVAAVSTITPCSATPDPTYQMMGAVAYVPPPTLTPVVSPDPTPLMGAPMAIPPLPPPSHRRGR